MQTKQRFKLDAYDCELDGMPLLDGILELQRINEILLSNGWFDLTIECNSNLCVIINGKRPLTESERMEEEEKSNRSKEIRYRDYLKLKNEFENGI